MRGGEVFKTLTETVTYSADKTPLLEGMDPRFGTVTGGTTVTFTGQSFSDDKSKYHIKIDGFDCAVQSATTSSVTCITSKRPGLHPSSLQIYIDGMGLVSNQ